jgi:hypothetical protein
MSERGFIEKICHNIKTDAKMASEVEVFQKNGFVTYA